MPVSMYSHECFKAGPKSYYAETNMEVALDKWFNIHCPNYEQARDKQKEKVQGNRLEEKKNN